MTDPLKPDPQQPEIPDAELVRRAQCGDKPAFDRLVARYYQRVVDYCTRVLENPEHGKDAAQNALVRAWQLIRQVQDPERFVPWLMRVALTSARNLNRNQPDREAQRSRWIEDPKISSDLSIQIPGPEQALMSEASPEIWRATIKKLAATARPQWDELDWMIYTCLFERTEEELTYRAIAAILGRSENTIKDRAYRRIFPVVRMAWRQLNQDDG